MPPIDLNPIRAVQRDPRSARPLAEPRGPAAAQPASPVELSGASDPGPPPIDHERVAMIREAIEQGRYPVIPLRVADALIASGLLLRTEK
jgi:negative regulator of flagellin synthesis FlgM